MVQRCNFCGLFASQDYEGSGLFRIKDEIYCSVNCYYDKDKNVPSPKNKSLGKAIIKSLKKVIKHKGKKKLETKKRKVS